MQCSKRLDLMYMWIPQGSYMVCANSKESDQTAQKCWLIGAFTLKYIVLRFCLHVALIKTAYTKIYLLWVGAVKSVSVEGEGR